MKYTLLFIWLLAVAGTTHAQQWTLRQCIDYALEHNIEVKQRANTEAQRKLQLSTDRNSRLPDLNAGASQNFSFGRGLTADNTYTNTSTSSTSFSLSASMPLFDAGRTTHTIKLDRLNLQASTADLEKAKNDIRVNVAQAYVDILYKEEIEAVARRQITIDSLQADRLEKMLASGKASEAELAQQRATLAASRLTLTQAENDRQLSLLTLTQLLELPTSQGFSVAKIGADASNRRTELTNAEAVYAEAIGIKPEVEAELLRLKGTEHSISVAKSSLYPSLSLSGGLGSNYYTTSGYKAESFGKQLKNNFSQYIGLSLNVPIFNRFATRNSIRQAQLERDNQMLAVDNVKKTLYKEIQQVCQQARAVQSKLVSSEEAERSSEAAFELAKAKYENGKANITEFNEAKNNLLKAQSDLTQAKYEAVYQQALVDFYRGKELAF